MKTPFFFGTSGTLIAEEKALSRVDYAMDLGEKKAQFSIVALQFEDGTTEHVKLFH